MERYSLFVFSSCTSRVFGGWRAATFGPVRLSVSSGLELAPPRRATRGPAARRAFLPWPGHVTCALAAQHSEAGMSCRGPGSACYMWDAALPVEQVCCSLPATSFSPLLLEFPEVPVSALAPG